MLDPFKLHSSFRQCIQFLTQATFNNLESEIIIKYIEPTDMLHLDRSHLATQSAQHQWSEGCSMESREGFLFVRKHSSVEPGKLLALHISLT